MRYLLICDAPRRGYQRSLEGILAGHARVLISNGIAEIDLLPEAYDSLLLLSFWKTGPYRGPWFAEQSLLAGILGRGAPSCAAQADIPLLRRAVLACAQGEAQVKACCASLRPAHARALREGNTASTHASAALLAHWLYSAEGIGLPLPALAGRFLRQ